MTESIPEAVRSAFERKAHPYYMWEGIQNIAAGLEDILHAERRSAIRAAAAAIQSRPVTHFIGCGTSYFASLAATYAMHQVAGQLATAGNAFEFLAYPPAGLAQSALVGISHTGSTPVVVQALQATRAAGAATIGVTDVAAAPIARAADRLMASTMGTEPALPKTRSYAAALLRLFLLSVELARLQGKDVAALEAWLQETPGFVRQTLEKLDSEIPPLAARWTGARRMVVIGGGPQWATAMEGSLKLTEAALTDSMPWELEEAVHGTWAATTGDDLMIVLAMAGPSMEKCHKLVTGMRTIGAAVWVITNTLEPFVEASHVTRLDTFSAPQPFTPLLDVLPLYLFTYHLALARGIHPDNMRLEDPRFLQARMLMRESLR